jgi:ABC-type transport system involved in multi-copper enzyme maturation permease subunit
MSVNLELQRVNEWSKLRGFHNLFRKENRAWWGTRRWWINALLWPAILGGLVSIMLFVMPAMVAADDIEEVIAAGGPIAYGIQIGVSVFFRMGSMALAVGAVILSQDLLLDEQQSGVTEWLLAKPVARRAYVLAKLAASALAILILLVGLPSLLTYVLLSVRVGALYDWLAFIKGCGVLAVHTLFYLTLTLMLGTFFHHRAAIMGVALGSAIGGSMIGGFVRPLLTITPWILGSSTELVVMGKTAPPEMMLYPLMATAFWCVTFTIMAVVRFEKVEF